MTAEDRVSAVAEFGFTPRQARFLVLVMRHAGICLLRQYSAFAGIIHGQKTRAFFHKLVSRRFASAYECRHNRGRLYHVHHYALYRAIEEPNSSYRRPVAAGRVAERLMLLDAVLADPTLKWLTTVAEKVAHFTVPACSLPLEKLPRLTMNAASQPAGHPFPDKLPIGIDASSRAVLLYLVLPSARDDFRAFLRRHAGVFQTLPSWTLRLVFPRAIAHAYSGLQTVVRDELESPRHPKTVEELRWYFGQLQAIPNPHLRPTDERFVRAAEAFERPRFYPVYRQWLKNGDRALADVASTLISDALTSGSGRVESLVLPHRYEHLSPLVTSSHSHRGEPTRRTEFPVSLAPPHPSAPCPGWPARDETQHQEVSPGVAARRE